MQTLPSQRPPQHRVIAKFEGSSLTFALPREATFADLACRLTSLGEAHRGRPISVAVRVGA